MERRRIDDEFLHRSNRSRDCLSEEMESVVATVSGYHGSERFKLIKLINQTGASYVGVMTKSTTHLVCWKFEGRKYNLAKEFGTVIVSHRWFEDCVKEGKRLPEGRYVMQSGIKAGPISWEPPVASVRESVLTVKNGDRYNICNDTMATQIDKGCPGTSSHLLSETLVPELRQETKKFHNNEKNVASSISKQDSRYSSKRCSIEKGFSGIGRDQDSGYSSKRCSIEKGLFGIGKVQTPSNYVASSISKQDSGYSNKRCSIEKGFSGIGTDQDSRYSSKHCSIEKGFSGIGTYEDSGYSNKRRSIEKGFSGIGTDQDEASSSHPTSDYGKQKRAIGSSVGSAVRVEPTRKSRRLVKKNASRDIFESLISDEEQEPDPIEIHDQVGAIPAASNDSDDVRSDIALTMLACERECPPTQFCNHINITTASNNNSNVWRNEDALMPEGTSLQDITRLNNMPASSGSNTSNDNLVCSQARNSPTGFCGFEENMDEVFKDSGESREPKRLPPSTELSCVICWTDFSPTRGILPCGHRFCYSCIQNWADHNASIRKPSTCPLCKTSFVSITKVDDAVSSDQKIYSQTIPCASSAATSNISLLSDWDFGAQFSVPSVCHVCRFREPEDLLVSCHMCRNRWVHSYCLDPPSFPWTCVTCRDLRSLYQRYR